MQVPELFRRGFVMPETDAAEAELRAWTASPDMEVRYLPIEGDDLFYALWKTGVLHAINGACGVCIDDYEEELLEPNVVGEAASVVRRALAGGQEAELHQFLDQLGTFLEEAAKLKRPVLAVL